MVARHSIMPDKTYVNITVHCMLYIHEAKRWIYSLIAARQHNCKSQTIKWGTTISQNEVPIIIGQPRSNKLHSTLPKPGTKHGYNNA